MIELITITFAASIIAVAYQILIMPGELMQRWARFVNFTFPGTPIQKLLLCPYCFGGQLALWMSLVALFSDNLNYTIECLLSVPCTIVLVYFVVKNNFK